MFGHSSQHEFFGPVRFTDKKGRDCADIKERFEIFFFVYIHFINIQSSFICLGELFQYRVETFTVTAPGSLEIYDTRFVTYIFPVFRGSFDVTYFLNEFSLCYFYRLYIHCFNWQCKITFLRWLTEWQYNLYFCQFFPGVYLYRFSGILPAALERKDKTTSLWGLFSNR